MNEIKKVVTIFSLLLVFISLFSLIAVSEDLDLGGPNLFGQENADSQQSDGSLEDGADITNSPDGELICPGTCTLPNGGTFTGTVTKAGDTIILGNGAAAVIDGAAVIPPAEVQGNIVSISGAGSYSFGGSTYEGDAICEAGACDFADGAVDGVGIKNANDVTVGSDGKISGVCGNGCEVLDGAVTGALCGDSEDGCSFSYDPNKNLISGSGIVVDTGMLADGTSIDSEGLDLASGQSVDAGANLIVDNENGGVFCVNDCILREPDGSRTEFYDGGLYILDSGNCLDTGQANCVSFIDNGDGKKSLDVSLDHGNTNIFIGEGASITDILTHFGDGADPNAEMFIVNGDTLTGGNLINLHTDAESGQHADIGSDGEFPGTNVVVGFSDGSDPIVLADNGDGSNSFSTGSGCGAGEDSGAGQATGFFGFIGRAFDFLLPSVSAKEGCYPVGHSQAGKSFNKPEDKEWHGIRNYQRYQLPNPPGGFAYYNPADKKFYGADETGDFVDAEHPLSYVLDTSIPGLIVIKDGKTDIYGAVLQDKDPRDYYITEEVSNPDYVAPVVVVNNPEPARTGPTTCPAGTCTPQVDSSGKTITGVWKGSDGEIYYWEGKSNQGGTDWQVSTSVEEAAKRFAEEQKRIADAARVAAEKGTAEPGRTDGPDKDNMEKEGDCRLSCNARYPVADKPELTKANHDCILDCTGN